MQEKVLVLCSFYWIYCIFKGKVNPDHGFDGLGSLSCTNTRPLRIGDHAHITKFKSGKVATVSELAQKVKQERAFLFRALSLVNLAPDIIETILNGIRPSPKATAGQEEPATLTLSKLRKNFPERLDQAAEDV